MTAHPYYSNIYDGISLLFKYIWRHILIIQTYMTTHPYYSNIYDDTSLLFKYIWRHILIIQSISKNQKIVFILIKNSLNVCYIYFSKAWYLKNLWKIHENSSVTLSQFSPLNYSSRFFRSRLIFQSSSVHGLFFHVKMHEINRVII